MVSSEIRKLDEKYLHKPDWNQNDPTAPDYIKHRPFYTGDPVETVIVEETTVTIDAETGVGLLTATQPLEAGNEYVVTLDGTTYDCVAKKDEYGGQYIGNLSLAGADEDTGEPFVIGCDANATNLAIITVGGATEFTVKVVGFVSEIHKIDEKYLSQSEFERVFGKDIAVNANEMTRILTSGHAGFLIDLDDGEVFDVNGDIWNVFWHELPRLNRGIIYIPDNATLSFVRITGYFEKDNGEQEFVLLWNHEDFLYKSGVSECSRVVTRERRILSYNPVNGKLTVSASAWQYKSPFDYTETEM